MKVYKETAIVTNRFYDRFVDELSDKINEYQQNHFQIQVHYATASEIQYPTIYSALILAYTEE